MNQMMGRMFASRDTKKKYISPAGLFGIEVNKPDGDDAPGVEIKSVYATSPAATAGLQAGDRLLTLDGRWTDSISDAFDAASVVRPDTTIQVTVRRGEKLLDLQTTPRHGL